MATYTWRQIVDMYDPEHRERNRRPIVYKFGGGKVVKRQSLAEYGPYRPEMQVYTQHEQGD